MAKKKIKIYKLKKKASPPPSLSSNSSRSRRSNSRSNSSRRSNSSSRRSNSSSSSLLSGFREPPRIYCGNNRLDTDVVNGNAIIGTRNRCFRIGFGRGYHQPVDPNYNFNYDPIDDRRIFCGNGDNIPQGYDRLGNLPHCLLKGYGVGRRERHLGH